MMWVAKAMYDTSLPFPAFRSWTTCIVVLFYRLIHSRAEQQQYRIENVLEKGGSLYHWSPPTNAQRGEQLKRAICLTKMLHCGRFTTTLHSNISWTVKTVCCDENSQPKDNCNWESLFGRKYRSKPQVSSTKGWSSRNACAVLGAQLSKSDCHRMTVNETAKYWLSSSLCVCTKALHSIAE